MLHNEQNKLFLFVKKYIHLAILPTCDGFPSLILSMASRKVLTGPNAAKL